MVVPTIETQFYKHDDLDEFISEPFRSYTAVNLFRDREELGVKNVNSFRQDWLK